jgi:hypothetical protein
MSPPCPLGCSSPAAEIRWKDPKIAMRCGLRWNSARINSKLEFFIDFPDRRSALRRGCVPSDRSGARCGASRGLLELARYDKIPIRASVISKDAPPWPARSALRAGPSLGRRRPLPADRGALRAGGAGRGACPAGARRAIRARRTSCDQTNPRECVRTMGWLPPLTPRRGAGVPTKARAAGRFGVPPGWPRPCAGGGVTAAAAALPRRSPSAKGTPRSAAAFDLACCARSGRRGASRRC